MQIVLGNAGLHWGDAWFMLQGALNTIAVTILAGVLGTLFGILLGWLRHSSAALRVLSAPLIDLVRSVPLVIQLILMNSFLSMAGYRFDPFWLGTLVLSISMAVLTSEVVRGSFRAVPPPYRRAARSLGMTYRQDLVHITAPLAFRSALTPWIGLLIGLTKDSALVSVVGYFEFLRSAQVLITRTNEALLLLLGVGLFYFLICYPISRYSRRLEKKVAI